MVIRQITCKSLVTTKEDGESSTYHTNQCDVYHKQQKLYNSY